MALGEAERGKVNKNMNASYYTKVLNAARAHILCVRCTSKTKPKTAIIKSDKANVVVARKKVNKHTVGETAERWLLYGNGNDVGRDTKA